jgi:hypothetical protein
MVGQPTLGWSDLMPRAQAEVLKLNGGRQPAVDKLMVENPRSVILLNVPTSTRHPAFPWAAPEPAQTQAAPELGPVPTAAARRRRRAPAKSEPEPVLRRRRAPRQPPASRHGRPAG